MKSIIFLIGGALFLFFPIFAVAEVIPFDDERWQIYGEDSAVKLYEGKKVLFVSEGGASLNDIDFQDGIIEVDILFPDDSRGFSGVTWRMQDDDSYEHFYIRPHLNNKDDSTQYTPVFRGDTGWQLYTGSHYGVPAIIKYKQWMHLKIVVSGDQAEVYLDSEEPLFFINDLKTNFKLGAIGVSTTFAPTYYANFSYEKINQPSLKGRVSTPENYPTDLITKFSISEVVLDGHVNPQSYTGSWTEQIVETTGAINISRYRDRQENYNTVLLRLIVNSELDQLKKFSYGFSDDVVVFADGIPIAGGTNIYQSRDYRYLGSIGLFDDVYFQLKRGKNIFHFAVKENFGGWGFMGKFEDMKGISLN